MSQNFTAINLPREEEAPVESSAITSYKKENMEDDIDDADATEVSFFEQFTLFPILRRHNMSPIYTHDRQHRIASSTPFLHSCIRSVLWFDALTPS